MAANVGLPSVPRGLPRDLSAFLSSLVEQVRILSGGVRGSGEARALRASEAGSVGTGTSVIGQSSVGAEHIKQKSITSEKLADGCITNEKLAMGAVQERGIAADAVTEDKIKAGAVTSDKIGKGAVKLSALAQGVLPEIIQGQSADSERVSLPGKWRERPLVVMEFVRAVSDGGTAGPTSLAEVLDADGHGTGTWEFLSVGSFTWLCMGWRP